MGGSWWEKGHKKTIARAFLVFDSFGETRTVVDTVVDTVGGWVSGREGWPQETYLEG